MSTNEIDYDALATKYGGTSEAAPSGAKPIDYDSLAAKYGGTSTDAPTSKPTPVLSPGVTRQLVPSHRDTRVALPAGVTPVSSHQPTPAPSLGWKPPVNSVTGRTIPQPQPSVDTPQANEISQAPDSNLLDNARHAIANSAIGYSLRQTLPKVSKALSLTPTDTVYNPDYEAHKDQLVSAENLIPVTDHSSLANIERGAFKGASGLTSSTSMATLAALAVTGGLAGPAIPVFGKLVSAGFAAQTAVDLINQAPELAARLASGKDPEGTYEQLGRMGFDAAMLKGMVGHVAERPMTAADLTSPKAWRQHGEERQPTTPAPQAPPSDISSVSREILPSEPIREDTRLAVPTPARVGSRAQRIAAPVETPAPADKASLSTADTGTPEISEAERRFNEEPPQFVMQPKSAGSLPLGTITDAAAPEPQRVPQVITPESGEAPADPQARLASREAEDERVGSRVPEQRVAEDGTTAPGRADESVRLMDPKTLRLNPAEMQWRTLARNSIDANEPYDQTKAGILDIWWNPEAKAWQVVEGHHRANKALATNTPEVRTQVQHFADLKEARQWGALRNIENGNATALDAALYFRDSGDTPETLKAGGVNLKADLVQKASALSQLSNTLWEKYRTGELDEAKATAIGQHLSDPSQQAELAKLATKHNMSAAEIEQAARRIREAGSTTQDNMGLFGNSESSISNFVATAKLSSQLEKQLQSDKVALSFIANAPEARRKALARGDNSINVSKSSEEALLSASLAEGFKRLQNRTGPVSRLLDEAGARITQGEKRDVVYNETYPKIRDAILNEIGGQAGGLPSDNRQGGGQDSGNERSNSARNEDNAGAGSPVGDAEEPIKGPPEGAGDLFRPKATQPGGLSDGEIPENPEATYKPASSGRPARVELNDAALESVADAFGFPGRFEGLRTDAQGAWRIAKKLEANGDEASLNIALVIHQAAAASDSSQGVVLYQKGNPLAEAEETVHAGQASAGNGDLVTGVPHEAMQNHPAFQAMAERIREEVGDQQFNPMIHVAEGYNDLVNDEAPEVHPDDVPAALKSYYRAVAEKLGPEALGKYAEALDALRRVYPENNWDVPEGVSHAERAIQTVQSDYREGKEASRGIRGGNDERGSENGGSENSGDSGVKRPSSQGIVPGDRPATQSQSKSAESQGITARDVLRLGKRGPGQNAENKEADRGPEGGEDLKRPMGQGTAGSEMDGWLRGAKSLTVEPAGEQVGLFGDAEPMHRIVRVDADGNTERHLVTEGQLAQLQKQPAYKRAATQGRQQGLFGTS